MINTIKGQSDNVLAIIVKANYDKPGILFVTPDDYFWQLAYMHHLAGHVILPHIHNEVKCNVLYTKKVLIIKKVRLCYDFYSNEKEYLESVVIETGDGILLISSGHGFECLDETEMFEVNQGSYAGENDKTRFEPYSGTLKFMEGVRKYTVVPTASARSVA